MGMPIMGIGNISCPRHRGKRAKTKIAFISDLWRSKLKQFQVATEFSLCLRDLSSARLGHNSYK